MPHTKFSNLGFFFNFIIILVKKSLYYLTCFMFNLFSISMYIYCWYRILSALDLCVGPQKIQKIVFSPWVRESVQNDVTQPIRAPGHPKYLFLAKMTKMPLVNPKIDQMSNEVKTLIKQRFSQFYIKPELFRDF